MGQPDERLRISVSLSGGASLGAYHAGVLAALVTTVQALQHDNRDVRLDAIGGASAGALASMFAAHGLVNGLDTAELVYEAWVERVTSKCCASAGPNHRSGSVSCAGGCPTSCRWTSGRPPTLDRSRRRWGCTSR